MWHNKTTKAMPAYCAYLYPSVTKMDQNLAHVGTNFKATSMAHYDPYDEPEIISFGIVVMIAYMY
jgi:hypothetical protein